MLVAAIELAKKQREPVIEVVVGLVLKGVDVRGKEPGELFKAAQAFNARGTTYCDTGGMPGSSMPSMKE